MGAWFSPAIVRVFGRCGVPLLLGLFVAWGEARAGAQSLAECEALVRQEPRSLKGYVCFLAHQGEGRQEALHFLDARMQLDPRNPRPHLYAGLLRSLAGEAVDDREWRVAIAGFAREHEPAGEIYATTSLISVRCVSSFRCDPKMQVLLRRVQELARASGRVDLMQVAEIWTMKVSFALDDMDGAERAERRLLALGPPRSLWLKSETLQARAHLAASLHDYTLQRQLYAELLDTLDADDPRRPTALGGLAAATVHLAMERRENRDAAERLLREAIAEQERAGLSLRYAETGYLSSRVQLAMLLGPVPESFSLLRSTLEAQLARMSWSTPLYPRLSLAELLATADPPQLDEALKVADEAVEHAFAHSGAFEQARALVLRSRMRFRRGELSLGRADGLAALDHAERLREQQRAMPLRLRYAQSLSFGYQSLAGALTRYRPPADVASLDDAFQVMERLRARGLMETLLAEDHAGQPVSVHPPTLAQVRGQLGPGEALLSFQVWRPEPRLDAPYREGSSWLTVVTSGRVDAFPIPGADLLDPQIRAWTGLLQRRDGTDRVAGARLYRELLGPALAALPPGVERLILVPDGPLHRLPFDALSAGPGTPYLAERFAVSLAPSASLWLRFRAAPRLAPGKLLVLADPSEGSAPQAILRDSSSVLGALVHARREAEVALSAFPTGSELRTGPPASEAFLKSANLEGVSLLHLATHALVDERDPEHAAVVLAPGSPAEDGRLEPQEIGRLALAGKTVVLAGCETSSGPLFRGEGVMSLARAFFSAGATAVVGTLDRARDDEAGVFFSSLYRALGRGASIGDAVAGAKRESIRRGAPPAAWADVVLLGDAEARPRERETAGLVPLVLTGGVLALAGLTAGRRWRRSRRGVDPLAWGLLLALTGVSGSARAERLRTVPECEALVRREPRSLDGYDCLLPHRFTERKAVLDFLEERLGSDPEDPRPRLYRAIVHHLAGDADDEREYTRTAAGFAREHDLTGEFYALTAHVSARCVYPETCDERARALLERAGALARTSGKRSLLQHWETWRMKMALALQDFVAAEASQSRLLALGPPESGFLELESLQARAYLAANALDYRQVRALSQQMLDSLGPVDPRRALALGGISSATAHLALQGIESRENAERLVREALGVQERLGLALWYPEIGYLPSRLQLALLLGPTPESFALVRSALEGYRARSGWTNPIWAELALGELLAMVDPPRLEEALRLAEEAVEDGFRVNDFTELPVMVLRSRIRFRVGQLALARADGLAALDLAEELREHQSELPVRLRYAESLSFAYRSLSGDLLAHRAPEDGSAPEEAFQVMERLRARGLMETLLADERRGGTAPVGSATLRQIRAQLEPREALLSFEVWRAEPTMEAPFHAGSSWVTVLTTDGVRVYPVPNADVLEPQIRAWTGLLERRDGADRAPGARLHHELIGAVLADLPSRIDRLIVIPDGPLHRLPFDALSGGPGMPYLAERFEVSIPPSATLWRRFRAEPPLQPGKLLVLADPAGPTAVQAVRRDSSSMFGGLVHARREAEVALLAFPPGSELRVGPSASESFLKSADLTGVSLLHLATHAIADERDPERAAVVLAPGSPTEDGRLEPREIARLPLNGKTVVLAGCETSAGPVFRGEGVMSLARAFFSAGATAVVGTLHRTPDDEAGAFFTALYRSLARGATIGEAVAAAKRDGIRRGAPPAAWAGVVLLGNAEVRPRAQETSGLAFVVAGGVALTCTGVWAGRRWRRRRPG